jgi:hypothetical protein
MGMFQIRVRVSNPGERSRFFEGDFWVDIGLAPKRSIRCRLADGTVIERLVSECHIMLPQGDGHTPVILGQPGDEALLGTITLENLGLVLNPFTRMLQPMQMLLA